MRSLRNGSSAGTGTLAITREPQNGGSATSTSRFSNSRRSRAAAGSAGAAALAGRPSDFWLVAGRVSRRDFTAVR